MNDSDILAYTEIHSLVQDVWFSQSLSRIMANLPCSFILLTQQPLHLAT